MKKLFAFLIASVGISFAFAQADVNSQWSWVKGDSTRNHAPVYGVQGVAASANNPGSRRGCITWTDNNGKLWLFGGMLHTAADTSGYVDDLWKYDPGMDQWTWMKGTTQTNQPGIYGTKGVAADINRPGARGFSCAWKDANGKLWLFGGNNNSGASMSSVRYNDLWKYDPLTNQWTWINGSNLGEQSAVYGTQGVAAASNMPGARSSGVSWIDATGNFWLFGGTGRLTSFSAGLLNDVWKYDPAIDQWTWMKGDNAVNKKGVHGTIGIPAPANNPGGRISANGWVDNNGMFWLFAGIGPDAVQAVSDEQNDLWRYDATANVWTWMKGSNIASQPSVYGTLGSASAANTPGARSLCGTWKDNAGNLWLFGGYDFDFTDRLRYYNDLWVFKPASNEWTWIKGDSTKSNRGIYGTLGLQTNTNKPAARMDTYTWVDTSGNFWMLAGMDSSAAGKFYLHNDLWKFGPEHITNSCNNGMVNFTTNITGASYQWQISTDSLNYTNIFDNANYSGTSTPNLQLTNVPSSWYGYRYRCVVSGHFGTVSTLRFKNSWVGGVNSNWENPANWSCNNLPDINTDVEINNGNVVLNSNATIRTLKTGPGAVITIATGNLVVLH